MMKWLYTAVVAVLAYALLGALSGSGQVVPEAKKDMLMGEAGSPNASTGHLKWYSHGERISKEDEWGFLREVENLGAVNTYFQWGNWSTAVPPKIKLPDQFVGYRPQKDALELRSWTDPADIGRNGTFVWAPYVTDKDKVGTNQLKARPINANSVIYVDNGDLKQLYRVEIKGESKWTPQDDGTLKYFLEIGTDAPSEPRDWEISWSVVNYKQTKEMPFALTKDRDPKPLRWYVREFTLRAPEGVQYRTGAFKVKLKGNEYSAEIPGLAPANPEAK